jgi:hypothetical protein
MQIVKRYSRCRENVRNPKTIQQIVVKVMMYVYIILVEGHHVMSRTMYCTDSWFTLTVD